MNDSLPVELTMEVETAEGVQQQSVAQRIVNKGLALPKRGSVTQ